MNVERLRPVILSILEIQLDYERTADMIIRLVGASEAAPTPIPPAAAHRAREVRLSDKRRTRSASAPPAASIIPPVRPLTPTDYYTAAEIAQYLQMGVDSVYSLVQRESDAFPYQLIENTGQGPKHRKVYLGRGVIQYQARRAHGRSVAAATDADDIDAIGPPVA